MPDLVFGSTGTTKVLNDQQKLADGAKAMAALYKQENRELKSLGKDAERIYKGTRSEMEKLRAQAETLRKAVANTKLSKAERDQAALALGRVETKIRSIGSQSDKAKGKLKEAFGGGASALFGSFVTVAGAAAAAVGATIKVVTDELRAAQELANKAAATQISVAASRNVVIRNLPGASDQQIQAVLAENERLAGEVGVSERAINQARASALSASGGNVSASLEATKIASLFLADRPAEIGDFAGSLLDLAKVTGTTDGATNLGLLSAVGGLSRITSQQQQAQSIPSALIGAREFGFTTSEAAALFSTITTSSGDLTGKTAGTATIQLAKQLEAFNAGGLQGKTTGEKLRALQSDRELANAFLSDASFETKSLGPIRALLTNAASDAAKSFASNLKAIPEVEGLRARGQQALSAFDNNTLEGRARLGRALDSAVEQGEVAARKDILSEDEVSKIESILQRQGGFSSFGAVQATLVARGRDRLLSKDEAAALIEPVLERRETNAQLQRELLERGSSTVSQESVKAATDSVQLLQNVLKELTEQTRELKKDKGGFVSGGS